MSKHTVNKSKICPNCSNEIPIQTKLNNLTGYKARNGKVFCKCCSTEIK
jgi:hypothetical protein